MLCGTESIWPSIHLMYTSRRSFLMQFTLKAILIRKALASEFFELPAESSGRRGRGHGDARTKTRLVGNYGRSVRKRYERANNGPRASQQEICTPGSICYLPCSTESQVRGTSACSVYAHWRYSALSQGRLAPRTSCM